MIVNTDPRLEELFKGDTELWAVSDDTGLVRLSVGPDGNLVSLILGGQWWQKIKAEALGPLVLDMLSRSKAARAVSALELEPLPESADAEEVVDPKLAPMDELAERMNQVLAAFSELNVFQSAMEKAIVATHSMKSDQGNVSLELTGGRPRALSIDPYNVQFVPPAELAAEVMGMFERASFWLDEQQDGVLRDSPHLLLIRERVRSRMEQ